jgi:hypothetical protein
MRHLFDCGFFIGWLPVNAQDTPTDAEVKDKK